MGKSFVVIVLQVQGNQSPPNMPCAKCGSTSVRTGAGRKPQEESRRCSDCGGFLGYLPVKPLKKLRKQRKLAHSLNLLESHGIKSEAAQIFVLSRIGAMEVKYE